MESIIITTITITDLKNFFRSVKTIKPSVNKSPTFSVQDFWTDTKDVGAVTGLEVKLRSSTENRPSWAFDYVSKQKSF